MSNIILGRPRPLSNNQPACPDLAALSAGRWRVSRDPVAPAGDTSPWAQVLVGRFGEVYPHDRDRLAVEVWDDHIAPLVAAALRGKLPWQRGDGSFCYIFPADQLPAVAQVIQARQVRHWLTTVHPPEGSHAGR
jgi:hypothetical protein